MFSFVLIISLGVLTAYVLLILFIRATWKAQPSSIVPQSYAPKAGVSVVVCARNESNHLRDTISHILANNYPENLLELILVNDSSEDDTLQIMQSCKDPRIHVVNLIDKKGKKAGIQEAINHAKFDFILLTDADCLVSKNWIRSFIYAMETIKADFITGPVIIKSFNALLDTFQSLDTIVTTAVTQAGLRSNNWFMANGANMGFKKVSFDQISGFTDNAQWASGDDMFLVEKVALGNGKVHYLKTSQPVVTKAEYSWTDLFKQRLRWATKNKSYAHYGVTITLGLVFLFNLTLLLIFLGAFIFGVEWWLLGIALLLLKMVCDYMLVKPLLTYYHISISVTDFIKSTLVYLLYINTVGIFSLFVKKYTWKGRLVE